MSIFKKKFNSLFIATLSLGLILAFGTSTIAQQQMPQQEVKEDFSDEELKLFVKANEKVAAIQAESEQKMVKAIEDAGLTVDRFNEIIASQQNPQQESSASEEEMSSFNNAAQVIMQERQKTEAKMTQSIESEGLDVNSYQEMMYAYQQSPKVQEKINEILEGK